MKVMDEKALGRWLYDHETCAEGEEELSVMSNHVAELFKGRVLVDADEWRRVQTELSAAESKSGRD